MYRKICYVICSSMLFFGGCDGSQTEPTTILDTDSSEDQNTDSTTDEHPGSDLETDSKTDHGSDAEEDTETETESETCETFYIDAGACPEYPPEEEPCEHECLFCDYGDWDAGCGGVSLLCLNKEWIEHSHADPGPDCDDAGAGE